ncbi:MAG: hypothetical protein H0V81_17665 [Solirubrobacterales bacterium]|nr:hypothetical protein [Solirubrobacterales bacterium]
MELVAGSADQKLIAKWDQNLRACQQARVYFERQWHENLCFYFGRQWIVATQTGTNGSFRIVEQSTQDNWRVRHTANRILRIIRTELTKLSKEEPQYFCMPSSTEEKDRLAAMAGDAIAEFILRTKYFNRKRAEATLWAVLCGTGYLKNYYDPNAIENDGKPGKIDFEAVTAFHLFAPNLQVVDIQRQPYIMHNRTMSQEEVWASYEVELEPNTESSNLIMDSRFISALGVKGNKSGETNQCYVKEVYVKPNKEFPNGAMFVYGENKILYVYEKSVNPTEDMEEQPVGLPVGMLDDPKVVGEESFGNLAVPPSPSDENETEEEAAFKLEYDHEFSYGHGRYPFAKIDHIPTGMFYAESVIKSLISPQKEYNRTRSIQLEHRNLAGKPQWWYTAGSFDPRKFNSKPGLLLAVAMGFNPPQPLEQPVLPSSVEVESILRDMDDISAQYEITKGRTPPGVEAASAIAYLAEENDTILHHTVQSLEDAVQETGIQVLANVHDFWDEERIVRMTSRNQYMEVREFKAVDLNPITDFRVEVGSMAPRSLAAKQAFLTELMKMGALDPQKAMRYLQMSETNKLYEELMIDVRHTQRENVFMSQGNPLNKSNPEYQAALQQLQQMAPQMGISQNPEQMMQFQQMQEQLPPEFKQDQFRDPSTGEPVVDETGQVEMYNVTTNSYDAHEVHVEEHQNFQKSQEYELLDDEIKQIIQDHVDEHKMELLKERNAVQADQQKAAEAGLEQGPPKDTPSPRELEPSANG